MSQERLIRAIETGRVALPDGVIGAWNAPADLTLGQSFVASQSFAPAYATLQARGISVSPTPDTQVDASIVFCHRAKEETFALLAQAIDLTRDGGLILLDGNKTDGVDSVIRSLRAVAPEVEVFAKAHGKLASFVCSGLEAPEAWRSDWKTIEGGFVTWPGIFSSDGIDAGSQLLAKNLPPLDGTVADLGAGWGYLSHTALGKSPGITGITLVEADFHAAEAARRNVTDPRATVVWGDVETHQGRYDAVICNPPFHIGRKPDPRIGQAFIEAAARLLTPRGQLWLVANQTLPYETTLERLFRSFETVTKSPGFKVLKAIGPQVGKSTARQRRTLPLS